MKHWYNNSFSEILLEDTYIIPEGFIPGRLPFSEDCKKKMGISRLGKYNRKNNPYHSEEDKKKISDSLKKRYQIFEHPSKGRKP